MYMIIRYLDPRANKNNDTYVLEIGGKSLGACKSA